MPCRAHYDRGLPSGTADPVPGGRCTLSLAWRLPLFLCLCAVAGVAARQDGALAIRLVPGVKTVALGEPLDATIEFENISESPLVLERVPHIGPLALDVIARRGDCSYRVQPMLAEASYRTPVHTQLLQTDTLVQRATLLREVNTIALPGPGHYTLEVTFRSEGPEAVGDISPIWRGFVRSPPAAIEVGQPDLRRLARERALLERDVKDGAENYNTLEYFSIVKDGRAADLLIQLLNRVEPHPLLLDIVASQGRLEDAQALDVAASRVQADPKLASYARELAAGIRRRDPCRDW